MTESKPGGSAWPIWVGGALGGVAGLAEGHVHATVPLAWGSDTSSICVPPTRAESETLRDHVLALQKRLGGAGGRRGDSTRSRERALRSDTAGGGQGFCLCPGRVCIRGDP